MIQAIFTTLNQYIKTKWGRSFSSREELEHWQDQQVHKHLKWIIPRSPFYQQYIGNRPLSEWRSFPTIDKKIMMDHFDTFNLAGLHKEEAYRVALQAEESRDFSPTIGKYTIGLSSGTSGHRGLFVVSDQERFRWAGYVIAKLLPRSLLSTHRIAFFLRANSNLYTSVERGNIQFCFFDLMLPPEEHVERLQLFQPTLLVAPPSMLRYLADQQLQNQLAIQPQKIISVAEVLDPLDQTVMTEAFGQVIHQVYQCTEGLLATTCEHGTLHINEDLLVVQKEYLDEEKRKFSPILTDFSRITQPIIRYRLNDILTERSAPCPCGSIHLALEQIEGRCDDLFYFLSTDGSKQVPIFPDFIRRAIITVDAEIEEYKVIQIGSQQIEIAIKTEEHVEEQAKQLIIQSFDRMTQEMNVQMPTLQFVPYQYTPGTTKLRRVEQKWKPHS
ncbi:F390 synthetase-related protein [Hazenella coriacea]|uniref:Putative adenylate-forming enzyme n=1 Tax=Hazenella coriacea TaxID=1179467 RepID=A0A4R3LAT0_9BACL|nr:F390 synthetase-related protein [Hazenella coriacea]TCS96859.1 putative adenylate-forming enzyme [Hazenella coriacea]